MTALPSRRAVVRSGLRLALWTAYLAVLLFLALGPFTVDTGLPQGDKLLHGLAFAGLVLLWPWRLTWPRLWIAPLTVIILAAGVEMIQDLCPDYGRNPDWYDFLAGVAGGLVGLAVIFPLSLRRHREP